MARQFTDMAGRSWTISIGLYTAHRIKELSEGRIDFVETSRVQSARNALIEMSEDVELSGRVLWWLCEAQAGPLGITEQQFADGFDLDVLDAAQTAVAEAIIDFFPNRARPALRRAAEIARDEMQKQTDALDAKTQQLIGSPEFEEMVRQATRGSLSGNSLDPRTADPLMYSGKARN